MPNLATTRDESARPRLSSGGTQVRAIEVVAISLLFLVPCFWQKRIQATDLSSHIYNAWLVSQVKQGQLPGLYVARQWNNVAFDLALEWLLVHLGVGMAQRVAVSAAVLIFAWGGIVLLTTIAGRNWWFTIPCMAMLSFGFIYHMGFFNFYLGMGLCLWYLAFFWRGSWKRRLLITPILLVAWLAHPLPVVWAVGLACYLALARMLDRFKRMWLLAGAVLALFVIRQVLMGRFVCSWSWSQAYFATGANQVLVFGPDYAFILAGVLFVWLVLLRRLIKERGLMQVVTGIPFQLWLLSAAAVFLLPNRIDFPGYGLPFSYVIDRLSLGAGIMLCAVLGFLPSKPHEKTALLLVTVAFFGLIFLDTWTLNRLEDGIDRAISQLPEGQRVLGYFPTRIHRMSPLLHGLDRACIGHCFSYANYEPSSRQFRLRAQPGNPYVFDEYRDSDAVQTGTYVVQPRDLPVYLVYLCGDQRDRVCSRGLQAGEVTGQ